MELNMHGLSNCSALQVLWWTLLQMKEPNSEIDLLSTPGSVIVQCPNTDPTLPAVATRTQYFRSLLSDFGVTAKIENGILISNLIDAAVLQQYELNVELYKSQLRKRNTILCIVGVLLLILAGVAAQFY